MNKAVESVLVVVAAVGFYVCLPVLMIWGWVRGVGLLIAASEKRANGWPISRLFIEV